ncbi:hypothetical protein [Chryseobacterium sp. 3008163]|uniref:hypothetical protein n=1 Tax=Chryseobacterium sp. 3008163 TaxID=2478663 RepID=UPI001E557E23|nr:hypothetical protein [Chryseobacterium sp. 3008163]
MTKKLNISIFILFLFFGNVQAQIEKNSPLFLELKKKTVSFSNEDLMAVIWHF